MDVFLDDYEVNEILNGKKCFTVETKNLEDNISLIRESTGELIKTINVKRIEQYKLDNIGKMKLPFLIIDGIDYDEYIKIIKLKEEYMKQKFISSYNGGFTIWNKNHIVCWIK